VRIIALTSNDYIHCLPPFCYLFNRHWPGRPQVEVVCYDQLPGELPANFEVISLGRQEDYTWSGGLLKYLETVPDELVLLLLEDYFLISPVDPATVAALARYVENEPSIGRLDLTADRLRFPYYSYREIGGVELVWAVKDKQIFNPAGGFRSRLFLMSFQASIWRKSFLTGHLNPTEDPWQAEREGTRRIVENGGDWQILGCGQPVLDYQIAIKAGKPGLWRTEKIPPHLLAELNEEGLL
jgi:hypothetical protein